LNRNFRTEETPHTTHMNTLKKSQPLRITHMGIGGALNQITVYATVGNYDRVVDYYAAKCVEHILHNELLDTEVEMRGIRLKVTLE
jgi:hypothetical protein